MINIVKTIISVMIGITDSAARSAVFLPQLLTGGKVAVAVRSSIEKHIMKHPHPNLQTYF